jgi:hypothetical protein
MLDLLDLGHDRLAERPGHPNGNADIRDWRHLWLLRNCCLVALTLKEDGTLSQLGRPEEDGLTRSLLKAAAGLRDLAYDDVGERSEALAAGHRTLTRLIGEIPFAQDGRRPQALCSEEDAEAALIDAADAVLEVIEEKFPPISPFRSLTRWRGDGSVLEQREALAPSR